jgi:hypothetical protein
MLLIMGVLIQIRSLRNDSIDRRPAADPMGAVRLYGLRDLPRNFLRRRCLQMVGRYLSDAAQPRTHCRARSRVVRPRSPVRAARRPYPLSPLRCRSGHQPHREHRHRHSVDHRDFRRGDGKPSSRGCKPSTRCRDGSCRSWRDRRHPSDPPVAHAGRTRWAERRFQKSLIAIRENLPELMRDTRDSASLDDFLEDVLTRIVKGVHATRAAVILEREVRKTIGASSAEVLRWFVAFHRRRTRMFSTASRRPHFPPSPPDRNDNGAFGWLLIGPRPDGSIAGKDEQEALETSR